MLWKYKSSVRVDQVAFYVNRNPPFTTKPFEDRETKN